VPRPGADGTSQPDLLGALEHGDQRGVRDPDRADQQADQREDEEQPGQVAGHLALQVLRVGRGRHDQPARVGRLLGGGDLPRHRLRGADPGRDDQLGFVLVPDARLRVAEVGQGRVYETNVFGVVAVTNAFLPALRRSAHPRIVNISSGTGSLAWATGPRFPHAGTMAAYRSSKAALNAVTVFYAHALGDGFRVNALAPGLRRTDLNAVAAASDGDPAEAAAGAVRLALLPDDGPTGAFISWDGTSVHW
jgi:NAD(P)-dependent dehydrogenase (short-subunit alcohol dehydrogenase family)